ncbi:MAG: hypothetical protein UX72_C0009G0009 [Parcubacteria group bacterium GW2011_GWA2_47_10]|nr:MAG: hypothetical protein UX72_C0009G0009 [Parcubacteria group bacterium GW2011_GWA2_47_10]
MGYELIQLTHRKNRPDVHRDDFVFKLKIFVTGSGNAVQ